MRAYGLDTPLAYTEILRINGLADVLWAIISCMPELARDRILRLHAISGEQSAPHRMRDERSRAAVRTAHLFVHGEATRDELFAAPARDNKYAAWADASVAATSAAWADTSEAARKRQVEWLQAILEHYDEAWG